MGVLRQIKNHVPASIKRGLRSRSAKSKLATVLAPHLMDMVCVDVGASYYPHGKWHVLLESARTRWIAVEPNTANLGYVQSWPYPSQITVCGTGLSEQGGPQTLYVTNVDSGSSLLPPVIAEGMKRRVTNVDYFFPVQERIIDTLTLPQVLAQQPPAIPVCVKLDTQGTELSILRGGHDLLASHRIVGVEMEATLLAQPLMLGSGRFWEACQYFESLGYELLDLKPIFGPSRLGISQPRGKTYLNECDAVFALRQDVAARLGVAHRAALLAFYCCYSLYEEALSLLQADQELRQVLAASGCALPRLESAIRALA